MQPNWGGYNNNTQNNTQYPMDNRHGNIPMPIQSNNNGYNKNSFGTVFNPLPNIPFNGYDPKSLFDNHNFVNSNNLLHNNLHNIILNEKIREYSVLIDSKDRNYQAYPDPFHYTVSFNPLPSKTEIVNGKKVVYETPNPIVQGNFDNVRYIKLEDIFLPIFTKVTKKCEINEDGNKIMVDAIDGRYLLPDDIYNVLTIKEYTDVNNRSTNDVLNDSFATVYYDYRINETHYHGYTKNGIKIFAEDDLATINKFRIDFYDQYGKPLRVPSIDKNIISDTECDCDEDDINDPNNNCFRHNLHHPLNPIFQHHIHFKIGVVEPHLNKKVFS
jgi:hypothetical protein